MELIGGSISLESALGKDSTFSVNEPLTKKSIQCESIIDSSLQVRADSEMLQSILQNLLSNAIKFTPKGGAVKIDMVPKKNHVEIAVSDTGVGISSENMEKLFRIDAKLSEIGTEAERGTGLGLLLCKKFVEKQEGTIEVKSRLDQGSTFTFTLPLAAPSEVPKKEKSSVSTSAHILIVEDDPDQQFISKIMLKKLGYAFDFANDGLEAVKKVKQHKYDLVLMDVYTPKMNGIQATERILEEVPPHRCPKILALTGDATQECQKTLSLCWDG